MKLYKIEAFKNPSNKFKKHEEKLSHTGSEVVDVIDSTVNLVVLPCISAIKIDQLGQIASNGHRLVHDFAVKLEDWKLTHWKG
jgi:hypothetical protein